MLRRARAKSVGSTRAEDIQLRNALVNSITSSSLAHITARVVTDFIGDINFSEFIFIARCQRRIAYLSEHDGRKRKVEKMYRKTREFPHNSENDAVTICCADVCHTMR